MNVTGLNAIDVGVGSSGSVILLIATVTYSDDANTSDNQMALRFTIDGTPEGPESQFFHDSTTEHCGCTIMYAVTGLSGDHDFAVQLQTVTSQHGVLSADVLRTFQVIEITDASLLVDLEVSSADDAVAGFTDIVGLSATPTVASGAVLLVIANMTHEMGDNASEDSFGLRATVGGAHEGPELHAFKDNIDEGCDTSLMWLVDGESGSTAFALQWDENLGAVTADQARLRTLQVIQITANVNKLLAQVSQVADTLTASFTDVLGMVATVSVDGTDSILLLGAGIMPDVNGDECALYRFFEDDTGEGPNIHIFNDGGPADGCGHSMAWAATGKSAGDHTFSVRGRNVSGTVSFVSGRNRSFSILELLPSAAVATVEGTGSAGSTGRAELEVKRGIAATAGAGSTGKATIGVLRALSAVGTAAAIGVSTITPILQIAASAPAAAVGQVQVDVKRGVQARASGSSTGRAEIDISTAVVLTPPLAIGASVGKAQLEVLRALATTGSASSTGKATIVAAGIATIVNDGAPAGSVGKVQLETLRAIASRAPGPAIGRAEITVAAGAAVQVLAQAPASSTGQALVGVLRDLAATAPASSAGRALVEVKRTIDARAAAAAVGQVQLETLRALATTGSAAATGHALVAIAGLTPVLSRTPASSTGQAQLEVLRAVAGRATGGSTGTAALAARVAVAARSAGASTGRVSLAKVNVLAARGPGASLGRVLVDVKAAIDARAAGASIGQVQLDVAVTLAVAGKAAGSSTGQAAVEVKRTLAGKAAGSSTGHVSISFVIGAQARAAGAAVGHVKVTVPPLVQFDLLVWVGLRLCGPTFDTVVRGAPGFTAVRLGSPGFTDVHLEE